MMQLGETFLRNKKYGVLQTYQTEKISMVKKFRKESHFIVKEFVLGQNDRFTKVTLRT